MFEVKAPCTETVNVWHAIFFGLPEGACVAISCWTALQLILPFALVVIVLQAGVNRLFFGPRGAAPERKEPFRLKAGQVMSPHRRVEE